MDFQKYVEDKKDFYDVFSRFIENENESSDEDFAMLTNYLENQKIGESRDELEDVLHLVLKVSKNHHRTSFFFNKIEKILSYLEDDIKQSFTNSELFDFFKLNKRLLLYLFENKVIVPDEHIVDFIMKKANLKRQLFIVLVKASSTVEMKRKKEIDDLKFSDYYHYFYPEIKSFLDEEKRKMIEEELLEIDENIFDNFDEKRQIGENHSYICSLIRDDSIDEFIAYTNRTNFHLTNKVNPSLFETNPLLVKKNPTLIEYAAFFGSIQIFQYLRLSKVDLNPSLWIYAIHGKNPDLIHLLEESQIKPKDASCEKILKESIKCHHNDIADYIQVNLLSEKDESENLKKDFKKNILAYSFHYYNYAYFPSDYQNKFIFYYACMYGYFKLVFILLQTNQININETIILTNFFFIYKVHILYYLLCFFIIFFFSWNSKIKIIFHNVLN